MKDRHPHLRAIEGLPAALRAVNKNSAWQLSQPGFRLLLGLYNACEGNRVISKAALLDRMEKLGSNKSRGTMYCLLWRLIRDGMIEQEGNGMRTPIKPSLAGTNYVRAVERYLRNMKWSDY